MSAKKPLLVHREIGYKLFDLSTFSSEKNKRELRRNRCAFRIKSPQTKSKHYEYLGQDQEKKDSKIMMSTPQ
jgi:hypothetical protein